MGLDSNMVPSDILIILHFGFCREELGQGVYPSLWVLISCTRLNLRLSSDDIAWVDRRLRDALICVVEIEEVGSKSTGMCGPREAEGNLEGGSGISIFIWMSAWMLAEFAEEIMTIF
jgi:hypothetical protein